MEKMPSGLYIAVRPEDIFWSGRSQSPGPILISRQVFVLARNRYNSGSSLYFVRGGSEIISSDAVQNGKSPEIINLLLSVIYCNLSQAGMQRLFRGEKSLSGLYADGTFRKDFLPRNKICARTGQIYRLVMVSGYKSCSLNLYAANSSHFVPFMP